MKFDDFEETLIEGIENSEYCEVEILTQEEVKNIFLDDYSYNFPMICFEETQDSEWTSDLDTSKFLNDKRYSKNHWYMIKSGDNIICTMSLYSQQDTLIISVFEIACDCRGMEWGKILLGHIERSAKSFYKDIKLDPFDTNATSFWSHMGFDEDNSDYLFKKEINETIEEN